MNRRGRPLASLSSGLCAVALVALVGCGEEEFSDEAYGAIDLAPYFFDGSSAANPTAGLPRDIIGKRGWVNGRRAEFYDFGLVNFTRKRSAAGATLAEPDTAAANPIYFFYDGAGRPMFSVPVYDQRTGTFHMRGGQNVLNPNPRAPRSAAEGQRTFELPYSARARNTVRDPKRGSDDYQRPIIDKLHNDAKYSGLWEIVEVTVTDSGYEPDSIKSAKTLLAAEAAGKVRFNKTGKVINCPVLDDRTWVTPSAMRIQMDPQPFMPVQPRIEVWFRTKLGSCFLANGWETLGRTLDNGGNLEDPSALDDDGQPVNVELYNAGAGEDRLDTFDVIRYNVGSGKNVARTVVVPIGKHYIPKVTVASTTPGAAGSDIRYAGDDLQTAQPRHFAYQQPGYTPLVWLHDITVPQDPPYQGGAFKTLDAADPQRVAARTGVFVKNFPVAGIATPCPSDGDGDCQKGPGGKPSPFGDRVTCNRFPDLDLATTAPPSGKNIVDVMIDREGGARCDVKKVGFGEYCAPGVSRCDTHVADEGEPKAILTGEKPKFADAGPKFEMPKAPDPVMGPSNPMDPMSPSVVTNQKAINDANAKIALYKSFGYHKNYLPRGYACHPSTGGYCYVRCDGSASAGNPRDVYKKDDGSAYATSGDDAKALDAKMSREFAPQGSRTVKTWKFNYDARCGGAAMLGYQCVSSRPNAQRVCLRECTTRNTDAENKEICNYGFNDGNVPGGAAAIRLGANAGATDGLPGQTCNNLQGATSCSWNPDFEPRGDSSRWPQ